MPSMSSLACVFVVSVMVCEGGILPQLPTLPSFSLPSLPNPFDGARGWYFLPDFDRVRTFWIDFPKQATNFLTKLVPQPIKNLLNFDPAPNWVPNPDEFEEDDEDNEAISKQNYSDLAGQSSENRAARSRSFNTNITSLEDDDSWEDKDDDKNYIPYEERGNLHGIGRDVIRSLTNTFGNITTGLDTDKNFFSGLLNEFKDKVKAIYPGTQWCGDGNIARTKKHLGFFRKTDNCCRQHDNCPDFIEREEFKNDLYNNGLFTRSNCDCDKRFYDCLKASNDMISTQIGTAYFTVLGPQCFKKEYPILHCRIQVGLTNRCIEYELDNSTQKIYQWFDNPEF